jgi:tripartite ATP-independent transporter DctP family solute receptor
MSNLPENNRVLRRTLLRGTAAAGVITATNISTRSAKAADFTVNWALDLPPSHPETIRAKEAADRIKAETGGKVVVQTFPSNQMGDDSSMLGQIRTGALDMASLSSSVISTYVPNVAIDGLGFVWKDYDVIWKDMDGDLGTYARGQLEKANILTMEKPWDLSFRQITTSTKPINTPDDLKGLRIRVPVSPLITALFKAIGASPTTVEWNETYTALQTKIVDAEENPLSIILTSKLYEVQKYCSITNHIWGAHWVLLSRRGWGRLPDDVKAVIAKHVNEAALAERADIAKLEAMGRNLLTEKGMIFNVPDHDAIVSALKKSTYYSDMKARFSAEAWALLEKYVGNLG